MKGSSNNKGKIFDQEGSAMDPINVELRSAPPALLVPYGTYEDEVLQVDAFDPKEKSPIESQNTESMNLGDNPMETPSETVVLDTKIEQTRLKPLP